jgi:dienelactone hydrolase
MRGSLKIMALCAVLSAASATTQAQQPAPGPIGSESGRFREQLHWVPFPAGPAERTTLLSMRVCRPPGDGPHKMAIVNHGSPARPDQRPTMEPTACDREAARWFLDQGFAVAFPLRRGYGRTGGAWAEGYRSCATPDYFNAGLQTADDIEAAIAYARELSFVRKDAIVVVGQSAGGWGTLALASRNPEGVAAFVNVAGGRGGWRDNQPNNNCTPSALVAVAGRYGERARKPVLWIYTPNDTFFAPDLSQAMYAAYTQSGGLGRFEMMGAYSNDGHNLFFGVGGSRAWGPVVAKFLEEQGVR